MRFVSANYFRYVSHAVRSKAISDSYLRSIPPSEQPLVLHAKQVEGIYDAIQEAAKEGKSTITLPHTHLLWQTPSVQKYLKEKGFELHPVEKVVKWWV
jgi:hypothetical protein